MPERIRVKLPRAKMLEARKLAVARNKKESLYGGMNYGNVRGSLEAHYLGMLGEMAVAHYFGLDVDRVIYDTHGDDGKDIQIPGYGNCQVKATTYWPEPWLRVESHKPREDVDAYVCVFVSKETYETWLIGWATKEEVVKRTPTRCVGSGPQNFILKEAELRQIEPASVPC